MKSGADFWRLFAAYERLTSDEFVALREKDFSAVLELQTRKSDIREAIRTSAAASGISLRGERFDRLVADQKRNLALINEQVAYAVTERNNLSVAGQRLRHFRQAYRQRPQDAVALSVQG